MGIFSSKTKIYISAASFPLASGSSDEVADAVLYAIFSGTQISHNLIDLCLNGMKTKVDQMRTYAQNQYTLGLPSTSYSDQVILNTSAVEDAIAEDVNAPYGVQVDFNLVDYVTLYYAAAPFLLSARGWDPSYNQISVYPSGMVLPSGKNIVRVQDVEFLTDTTAEITYAILNYTAVNSHDPTTGASSSSYEHNETTTFTETCTIPDGSPLGKKCCIAAYHILDAEQVPSEKRHWWFYEIASGKHPALDVVNSVEETNNLLPVIPIRYDNTSLVGDSGSGELYETSKKMLNMINVDIDELGESLAENPDIAEIDHAWVMFGIDLQTSDEIAIKYLVHYFDHLADQAAVSSMDYASGLLTSEIPQNNLVDYYCNTSLPTGYRIDSSGVVDFDDDLINTTTVSWSSGTTLTEYGLKITVSFSYIQSDIVEGSIGEVGAVEKSWQRLTKVAVGSYDANQDHEEESYLTLKLQITDNTYKRIIVKGLVHRNYIYGNSAHTTTLTTIIDDPDDGNFIIPVHYGVASNMLSAIEQNQLYIASLSMVVNSIHEEKVEWYERWFFRMFIMAVTMIIAAWTGQPYLMKLALAAEAGTMALLMVLMKTVLTTIAVNTAFKYVAEEIGSELAAILGTALAVISMIYVPTGSFNLFGTKLTFAETFMTCSNALLHAAETQIQTELEDISTELDAFESEAEEKMDALEDVVSELLETGSFLPEDLLAAQAYSQGLVSTQAGSPEEFYELAIHTGNIGTLSLDVVSSYHDIALTLPKPKTQEWGITNNIV